MILILESALLGCMLFLGIRSSISDCKNSIIPNHLLLKVLPLILLLDLLYYSLYFKALIGYTLINLVCVSMFSAALYLYNLWAAGDSKLLVTLTLSIPARLYTFKLFGPFPGFLCLVLIFSIAFLYVVTESIWLGIKNKDLFQIQTGHFKLHPLLLSYFFMVGAISVCNLLLVLILNSFIFNTGILITALDFMIVLSLRLLRDKMNSRQLIVSTILLWSLLLGIQILRKIPILQPGFHLKPWLIVFFVMLLRLISEKYNYQKIAVADLKPRMIPSALTVLSFQSSKVKGLPSGMTEDLRSRLSEEDIESIKRWSKSKQGRDSIVIVRKLPFAVFITIGTFLFVLMEALLIWLSY